MQPMQCNDFVEHLTSNFYLVKHIGHTDEVRIILFVDSLHMMFSAGWDCKIYGWAMPTFQGLTKAETAPKFTVSGHTAGIVGLVYDTLRKRLISASKDGFIQICELENHYCTSRVKVSDMPLFSLALDSSMQYLLTGGADKILRVWDIGSNGSVDVVSVLPPLNVPIHVVKDCPSYQAVVGSGDDNRLKIWTYANASTFKGIQYSHELVGHRKLIFSFDIHPFAPVIASGGQEKVIFLWDFHNGEPIRKISTRSPVSYLKFSPCGKHLLCVCFDNSVRIYDTETGISCRQFPMHEGYHSIIGLSNDWSFLAVAPFRAKNFAIRLWALKSPKEP